MRVGLDATCWSNRRGYGRFTRGLITALLQPPSEHEFVLFVDRQTYAQGDLPKGAQYVVVSTERAPTEAATASSRRSAKDLWAMSTAVARCPLDVFYFPSVYTYFPVVTRASVVLGVHDVIAEDYPSLVFPDRWRRGLWAAKCWAAHRQTNYLVTVSDYAKDGIVRRFGHPPGRVWVVDEAADAVFRPLAHEEIDWHLLAQHGIADTDRVLVYLGGVNPHKNLVGLADALAALRQRAGYEDLRLVVIGDIESDSFTPGARQFQERIAALQLDASVHFTGFVPDSDVVHFLNAALALVLPSFSEGFGLPAVEAAACGVPVVATRNSPLPALLAGGGYFFDPAQPRQLEQSLGQLLSDETQRRHMGAVALERARQLTWQRAAGQMQNLLREIQRNRRC